jgi:hypothetical protein
MRTSLPYLKYVLLSLHEDAVVLMKGLSSSVHIHDTEAREKYYS